MYALIDGNNFYVSCERVFRPSLNNKSVIVLSNNDGCAISRSDEAKALGVKMGQPFFQIQREFTDAGIIALSANFELYGDMSARMMTLAAPLGCDQEIYSIDESFIDLRSIPGDLTRRSWIIRNRILQCIGVPCCVGIGQTKTLAKLANHVAKNAVRKPGSYPTELGTVCNLAALNKEGREAILRATPVSEVWGVGRRLTAQLNDAGVFTSLDLANMPSALAKRWSVVLARTASELRGEPCIDLDSCPPAKKEIACTRSFGRTVTEIEELKCAVSEFAYRASEKLRGQGSIAGQVLVFISTSPFRRDDKQYSQAVTVPLLEPTSDILLINAAVQKGLQVIYKRGFNFARAGVHLLDLVPDSVKQAALNFGNPLGGSADDRSEDLMSALDQINGRWGRGAVKLGCAMKKKTANWSMRQELLTPRYTTCWDDVPIVQAN